MINWQCFPQSTIIPNQLRDVVEVFKLYDEAITSSKNNLNSNEVLETIRPGLEKLGFLIETGKKADEKIKVPVLFGVNGKLEKAFDADGYHTENRTVIEVEAGRAVANYQFLKDLFQACMMSDVDYLVIAVRIEYSKNKDFEIVRKFLETLYASGRLNLPLHGVLIIGY